MYSKKLFNEELYLIFPPFKDSRKYEQYIIMAEVIHTNSIRNISYGQVKIVFKRRIEYHLTNTFSQVKTY